VFIILEKKNCQNNLQFWLKVDLFRRKNCHHYIGFQINSQFLYRTSIKIAPKSVYNIGPRSVLLTTNFLCLRYWYWQSSQHGGPFLRLLDTSNHFWKELKTLKNLEPEIELWTPKAEVDVSFLTSPRGKNFDPRGEVGSYVGLKLAPRCEKNLMAHL
jgi:hypothetical protein